MVSGWSVMVSEWLRGGQWWLVGVSGGHWWSVSVSKWSVVASKWSMDDQ